MSSPSTAHDNSRVGSRTLPLGVPKPLEAVGFWSAVALPFLYVPLFVAGLPSADAQVAFAALVLAHAVTLFLGHGYEA
ncbi:hypothetical protein [Salarchaeum japonicum]|uniref:Uncharacterized protein n=1 Tax=Salarchaeum japonicum TaxID=555573 RepID=A0AAV3SZD8_9EURY|nr:hypothetical protein [Salarchaeum japonicum]